MRRLHVGDQVMVIRGEHKGRRAKVARVLPEKEAVVLEGVNVIKRHVKPNQQRAGGIVEVEAPLHWSKVMLIDPTSGKRTRVRYTSESGEKQRTSKAGTAIVSGS